MDTIQNKFVVVNTDDEQFNPSLEKSCHFEFFAQRHKLLNTTKAMPTSAAAVKLPKLDVFFEGGVHFEWPNPSEYTCVSFTCPTLPKSQFVAWWDLPLHKTAAFYETADCTYKRKKFTFNTGSTRSTVTGMHYFTGGAKHIRSVMLGGTESAELNDQEKKKKKKINIKRTCNLKKTKEKFDVNATVANLPYEADVIDEDASGGLSANWSDALPDLSDDSP